MLPSEELSHLPTPARAAIRSSRSEFLTSDRGHVRRSNDASADSRLRFFANWLESQGFTQQSAADLKPTHMIDILGAYILAVQKGHNLTSTFITGQTLRNYTKSAADCLTLLTGSPCSYYDPARMSMKRMSLHPYLNEQITQRSTWTKPKPRKEPCT